MQQPRSAPTGSATGRHRRLAAGVVGAATLIALGWMGLLVPTLIRSIEDTFGQDDAGFAVAYLTWSIAYAGGSFGGGWLVERLGRRWVLGGAALVHGLGIAAYGLAPTWPVFVAATVFAGVAGGCLDGGANGVVLDAYRERRGRAMNLLHVAFTVGALSSPLIVGTLVAAGVPWQAVVIASGATLIVLAIAYVLVPLPSGRRARPGAPTGEADAASPGGGRWLLAGPLLFLGIAIATYVASEVGVSNWLVRFLDPAPLATATLALSLYWAGLGVGRLIASAIADRFDHLRFTITALLGLTAGLIVAVLVPSLPLSIVAFAVAGVASGPVFPMIMAIAGDRYPDRSASVAGTLAGMGVLGTIVYPPVMGVLSVSVGLTPAMLGTAVLAAASAGALVLFGRSVRIPTSIIARTAGG